MAKIPNNFIESYSNLLASYNFSDILQGRGVLQVYACMNKDSFFLTNDSSLKSNYQLMSNGANSTGAMAAVIDKDFDVIMNRPLDIGGTVYASIPVAVFIQYSSASTTIRIDVIISKYDGSTETNLVTLTGQQLQFSSISPGKFEKVFLLVGTLPRTHLKQGEYLRVTIQGYAGLASGTGNKDLFIGIDPNDRTTVQNYGTYAVGTTSADLSSNVLQATRSVINIPVIIDI